MACGFLWKSKVMKFLYYVRENNGMMNEWKMKVESECPRTWMLHVKLTK